MEERDLAGMIVKIGLARGLDADHLIDELGRMTLPSFLDVRAFRASLVDTIEEQWRAELDARVRRLRDQLGAPTPVDGRVAEPAPTTAPGFAPPPPTGSVTQFDMPEAVPDATAADIPAVSAEGLDAPRDATQIWDARRG